jgi:hypothetical protein
MDMDKERDRGRDMNRDNGKEIGRDIGRDKSRDMDRGMYRDRDMGKSRVPPETKYFAETKFRRNEMAKRNGEIEIYFG